MSTEKNKDGENAPSRAVYILLAVFGGLFGSLPLHNMYAGRWPVAWVEILAIGALGFVNWILLSWLTSSLSLFVLPPFSPLVALLVYTIESMSVRTDARGREFV